MQFFTRYQAHTDNATTFPWLQAIMSRLWFITIATLLVVVVVGLYLQTNAQRTIPPTSSSADLQLKSSPNSTTLTTPPPSILPSTTSATTDNTESSTGHVTVNGTDIPVPANGSVRTVVAGNGGQTSVAISSSTNGLDTTNSFTSLQLDISSTTHSSSTLDSNQSSGHTGSLSEKMPPGNSIPEKPL